MTTQAPDRSTLKVLAFAGMCVGFFLFHIWFRTRVVTKGYEVAELRSELAKLESQSASLKVQKNRLKSSSNLERIVSDFAQEGHVFKNPESNQVFYLQSPGQ